MLKTLEDLHKPDPRHVPGTSLDAVIGMRIEDLHAEMQPLELHMSVPAEVRWQFDTARHAFVYSWFCYDLVTLAEQHAYPFAMYEAFVSVLTDAGVADAAKRVFISRIPVRT